MARRPGSVEHAFEETNPGETPILPKRYVAVVVVAGKWKPAIKYLDRIAAVAVPSFAVTPGEFGSAERSSPASG
jgi:hypothetical protein